MPSFEKHCEDCERELGDRCEEVNRWMDELFASMGPKHRIVRHHEGGVKEAEKLFGAIGKKAAEIHIKADCSGRIPTELEAKMWSLFTWGR